MFLSGIDLSQIWDKQNFKRNNVYKAAIEEKTHPFKRLYFSGFLYSILSVWDKEEGVL